MTLGFVFIMKLCYVSFNLCLPIMLSPGVIYLFIFLFIYFFVLAATPHRERNNTVPSQGRGRALYQLFFPFLGQRRPSFPSRLQRPPTSLPPFLSPSHKVCSSASLPPHRKLHEIQLAISFLPSQTSQLSFYIGDRRPYTCLAVGREKEGRERGHA